MSFKACRFLPTARLGWLDFEICNLNRNPYNYDVCWCVLVSVCEYEMVSQDPKKRHTTHCRLCLWRRATAFGAVVLTRLPYSRILMIIIMLAVRKSAAEKE